MQYNKFERLEKGQILQSNLRVKMCLLLVAIGLRNLIFTAIVLKHSLW